MYASPSWCVNFVPLVNVTDYLLVSMAILMAGNTASAGDSFEQAGQPPTWSPLDQKRRLSVCPPTDPRWGCLAHATYPPLLYSGKVPTRIRAATCLVLRNSRSVESIVLSPM